MADGDVHVRPLDDLIGHVLSDDCPCRPRTEPVQRDDGGIGWLHVHHSLDGRELREQVPENDDS
jgi:hypothetical protein